MTHVSPRGRVTFTEVSGLMPRAHAGELRVEAIEAKVRETRPVRVVRVGKGGSHEELEGLLGAVDPAPDSTDLQAHAAASFQAIQPKSQYM